MASSHELCILYLYHKVDALTQHHFSCLCKSNPRAVVIPLTDDVSELLPNSVDVATLPFFSGPAEKWRSIDNTLYRWFANRSFDAERYIVIEYDCFCNVDLTAYYAKAGKADVVGIDYFTEQQNPRWGWFTPDEVNRLSPTDRPYAAGITPFTCTLFTHDALVAIVANVSRNDVFCELRLGTVINKLSLTFRRLPFPERGTISWHPYSWQVNRPGLFHGIKSLSHNQGRRPQPGILGAKVHDLIRTFNRNRKFLPFIISGQRQKYRSLWKGFASKH